MPKPPVRVLITGQPQLDDGLSFLESPAGTTVGKVHTWVDGATTHELWEVNAGQTVAWLEAKTPLHVRFEELKGDPKTNLYAREAELAASSTKHFHAEFTVSAFSNLSSSVNGSVWKVLNLKKNGDLLHEGYLFRESSGQTRTDHFVLTNAYGAPNYKNEELRLILEKTGQTGTQFNTLIGSFNPGATKNEHLATYPWN
jgi:hypothetical protein